MVIVCDAGRVVRFFTVAPSWKNLLMVQPAAAFMRSGQRIAASFQWTRRTLRIEIWHLETKMNALVDSASKKTVRRCVGEPVEYAHALWQHAAYER